MFARSNILEERFEEMRDKIEKGDAEPVEIPENLDARVKKLLKEKPDITWHRALQLLVDPTSETDNDDDDADDEDEDDDDLDIDEDDRDDDAEET
jgi:hypothetical protein